MELLQGLTLVAATITTGLAAGLYYTFSIAVVPGLRQTDDRTYVHATQRTNVAILNGWFAVSFGGSVVLTLIAALLHLGDHQRTTLYWIIAGLVLGIIPLVITFAVNVPLNNEINAAGDPDKIDDLAAVRARFDAKWLPWNSLRAVVCTGSLGCLAWALVEHGRALT